MLQLQAAPALLLGFAHGQSHLETFAGLLSVAQGTVATKQCGVVGTSQTLGALILVALLRRTAGWMVRLQSFPCGSTVGVFEYVENKLDDATGLLELRWQNLDDVELML